ncbi:MAG: hypothetical protein [Microviridae sp.]|nr:MAG: hypothetical protein [Microviridae sp.]
MYKKPKYGDTLISLDNKMEGETIEQKVTRLVQNKEPIKDGVPIIYTDRKEGVNSAYNIRTDRWEIAVDAMTRLQKSKDAKRDDIAKTGDQADMTIIKDAKNNDGKAEPTQGKAS